MAQESIAVFWHEALANGADRTAYHVRDGSGYRRLTYRGAWDKVYESASAVASLELRPGDRLGIIGDTGLEWASVDWACQTLGIVTVPVFPSLPADQATQILQDAGASAVVVQDAAQGARVAGLGVPVVTFAELSERSGELDRARWEKSVTEPAQAELATIIYTSGTTGEPKGAMLGHQGFLDLCRVIPKTLPLGPDDVFLSWLPVAHVFERFAGHVLPISLGASIGYAGSVATIASDMSKVQPTIMLVVPRFLDSMRAKILDGVRGAPPLRQKLFALAQSQGLARLEGRFAPLHPVTDSLVGRKLRERTGGKLRYLVSGGSALPPDLCSFFGAFGITVLQGYGLTETTAASCLNDPAQNRPDTVGKPFSCLELRTAEDGEILIRGSVVMKGYWQKPEATAEAIDPEGWFRTGDLGELQDGLVRITDRKKDIQVLANGKNVAPQRVENLLRAEAEITEAVVFGDGRNHCVALIVPDYALLRASLTLGDVSDAEVVADERAGLAVRQAVDRANKALADFERVRQYRLLDEPFSQEKGELTPSMKVRRKVVRDAYSSHLAEMD